MKYPYAIHIFTCVAYQYKFTPRVGFNILHYFIDPRALTQRKLGAWKKVNDLFLMELTHGYLITIT